MDKFFAWIDRTFLELGREMRLSYLPPLMVYVAAGIQGLTSIVGVFFVKERLGLSAEFIAALGFWIVLPWTLKMPIGHVVDLIWRWKAWLIFLGAGLIACSLLIMNCLLGDNAWMATIMPYETWYVLAAILSPVGYVVQDVVADAMTVEAVPHHDEAGKAHSAAELKLMHTTMQTLGRVAIIGGGLLVASANVFLLAGVGALPDAQKALAYQRVYEIALLIPVVSVLGVVLAAWLQRRERQRLAARGLSPELIAELLGRGVEVPPVNWWVLGGGMVFALVSIGLGVGKVPYAQEWVFAASMVIVIVVIQHLIRELEPAARSTLIGTALVIFVFRAVPGPGPAATWFVIDQLGFDPQFLAMLSLIGSALALAGMFVLRRFVAEKPITTIVTVLAIFGTVLSLPNIGMIYGLHEWTAARTGGIIDARFIAVIDTAVESPLGQIAMIPMLAWIANSAPARLKATYFAVMASFTNLALSASQLGSKYLNGIFTVTREVKNRATGAITTPADYGELGMLVITAVIIGCVVPLAAVWLVRALRMKSA